MRKTLHHTTAILLALLLMLPAIFSSALETIRLYEKWTVTERMENGILREFSFPVHLVHWEEEGREISVEGTFYDIKNYSIENGIFKTTAVLDKAETDVVNLLSGIDKQTDQTFMISCLLYAQIFIGLVGFCLPIPKKMAFRVRLPISFTPVFFQKIFCSPPYPPPKYKYLLG